MSNELVTTKDHIRDVLARAGEPLRAATIIDEVLERIETTAQSVRTELSEMSKAGEVVRPRHGFYELPDGDGQCEDMELAERVDRITSVINGFGTVRAFAEAIGMTESRISKALSLDERSDRRLAPIEQAIDRKGLWRYAQRTPYDYGVSEPDAPAFHSDDPEGYTDEGQSRRRQVTHRTLEIFDEDDDLVFALELRAIFGKTKRWTTKVR